MRTTSYGRWRFQAKQVSIGYATPAGDTARAPAIAQMCAWLGVSRPGFYEGRSRPESATAQRRNKLKLLIAKAFEDSGGTYGYRRIARHLARWGVPAGRELVRALMRELGLVACQPRPWRPTTTQQGTAGPIPDLVCRDFTATAPGAKMAGDITYTDLGEIALPGDGNRLRDTESRRLGNG
jgi:putative transposase